MSCEIFDLFHDLPTESFTHSDFDLSPCSLFNDILDDSAYTTPIQSGRNTPQEDVFALNSSFGDLPLEDFSSLLFEAQHHDFLTVFSDEESPCNSDDATSVSGLSEDDFKDLKMKRVPKKKGRRPAPVASEEVKPKYARRTSVASVSSLPSSPCDVVVKRTSHNISERQRRKDLKYAFEILRECIPEICNDSRVHTGQILKHAIDYIHQLQADEARLIAAKNQLLSRF